MSVTGAARALSEQSEIVGFFSYSREDDADFKGALSTLRDLIQTELRVQLGRSLRDFRLWQDRKAIASGTVWEAEIKAAIAQAVFFIPVVTPTSTRSDYCHFEFDAFAAREVALGRSDLIFPILWVNVPALNDPQRYQGDRLLSMIAQRQWVDWRRFRNENLTQNREVADAIEQFCSDIVGALSRSGARSAGRRSEPDRSRPVQQAQAQVHETLRQAREQGQQLAAERLRREQQLAQDQATEDLKKRQKRTMTLAVCAICLAISAIYLSVRFYPSLRSLAVLIIPGAGSNPPDATAPPLIKPAQISPSPIAAAPIAPPVTAPAPITPAIVETRPVPPIPTPPAPVVAADDTPTLPPAVRQQPSVAPTQPATAPAPSRPEPVAFWDVSVTKWAIKTASNCNKPANSYTLDVNDGRLTWRSGTGDVDVETIASSSGNVMRTTTERSHHLTDPDVKYGTTWTYTKLDDGSVRVKKNGADSFSVVACP